ncbi:MAG: hypothetical protein ACKVPX_07735 [Myxococcaceae bacterium]
MTPIVAAVGRLHALIDAFCESARDPQTWEQRVRHALAELGQSLTITEFSPATESQWFWPWVTLTSGIRTLVPKFVASGEMTSLASNRALETLMQFETPRALELPRKVEALFKEGEYGRAAALANCLPEESHAGQLAQFGLVVDAIHAGSVPLVEAHLGMLLPPNPADGLSLVAFQDILLSAEVHTSPNKLSEIAFDKLASPETNPLWLRALASTTTPEVRVPPGELRAAWIRAGEALTPARLTAASRRLSREARTDVADNLGFGAPEAQDFLSEMRTFRDDLLASSRFPKEELPHSVAGVAVDPQVFSPGGGQIFRRSLGEVLLLLDGSGTGHLRGVAEATVSSEPRLDPNCADTLLLDRQMSLETLPHDVFHGLAKLFLERAPPSVREALGGQPNTALPHTVRRALDLDADRSLLEVTLDLGERKRWGFEFQNAFALFHSPETMASLFVRDLKLFELTVGLLRGHRRWK